jgi:ribosomal-protein-alanine N-acetyltransferase
MELEVRISNRAAIALYERAGFVQDGRRRGYYRDPEEDAVLMGLPLIS